LICNRSGPEIRTDFSPSHGDHAGGNTRILAEYKGLPVIGGKDCAAKTTTPAHGETFRIGDSITVKALHTPCHTQDSICYFVQDGDDKAVFTGDTLFIAGSFYYILLRGLPLLNAWDETGCGRFFEGTAEEMHTALNKILAPLPDDTKVYPGHEYTKSNAKFGQSVLDVIHVQKLLQFCESNNETQGKFTIGDEKV